MPRHFPAIYPVPAKEIIGRRQETYEVLITRRESDGNALGAGEVATIEVLTVPSNKRLYLGGGIITCNASCIQKCVMTHTPGVIGDYRYDMRGDIVLNPLSATIVAPGETLTVYIYNLDDVSRDFSLTLYGMLVEYYDG